MNTWFECKVRYETIDEQTGKERKITAPYLIDAVSYTEAEKRIHAEMEQYVRGEFSVKGIKQVNYTDLFFYDDGQYWYKVKVMYVSIDEHAGREKKVANWLLVMADNVKEAYERTEESMKSMTVDYTIHSIMESNILDVFPYFKDSDDMPANLKPLEDVKSKAYKDE